MFRIHPHTEHTSPAIAKPTQSQDHTSRNPQTTSTMIQNHIERYSHENESSPGLASRLHPASGDLHDVKGSTSRRIRGFLR